MNWIRVSVGITGDPRVYALADDLGIRPAEVVGLLVGVMTALPEHAPDGDLSKVSHTLLERWAGWDGERGTFAVRYAVRFLNDGVWAAWEKYNGSALRDAKSSAERAREWRKGKKAERTALRTPFGTPYGTENEPVANASTRRDETRRSTTTTTTPLSPTDAKASGGGWPAVVADAWTRTVGVISPGRVGKDLLPFVRLYPAPAAAESALVAAVRIYDDTCTRRSQSPKWVQFVAGVQGYVPQNQLPPTRVEVA